jgi:hypothetical protein
VPTFPPILASAGRGALFIHIASACGLALCALVSAASADIFVLEGSGEVRGQLLNPDESPRTSYVIKTASGGRVTLAADAVKEIKRQTPAEMKYDQVRGNVPDTVEAHWKMAEWCRENKLPAERKVHLEKILTLDPNHKEARYGLGYSQIGGRWVTQEQMMSQNGYIRSKHAPGKWVLPQEEEILAAQSKATKAQLDWKAKLKRWSGWLGTDKGASALANIKAIDDPFAVPALAKHLETDRRREARLLYVEALGRVNSPPGMEVLVGTSLADADEEIRMAALDQVVARDYKPAVARYVRALKHKDNAVINRAAVGLGLMKDPSAVGPLIDALVTTHTFVLEQGQPGQTTTTFGTGPNSGGFSFGGSSTKVFKRDFENRAVLQALVDLAGGVSFNYDVRAWKNWFAAQKKPKSLDARRDSSQ